MKKYLKMLPVMIYPYSVILCGLLSYALSKLFGNALSEDTNMAIVEAVLIVFQIVALVDAVYGAVSIARNNYSAKDAAKINLVVKSVQIPAYILHFIIGMFGCVLSIIGVVIIMFAITIDVLTITLTGINAIGCTIKLRKNNILSKTSAILLSICSFIFCVDFIVAIVFYVLCKKDEFSKKHNNKPLYMNGNQQNYYGNQNMYYGQTNRNNQMEMINMNKNRQGFRDNMHENSKMR